MGWEQHKSPIGAIATEYQQLFFSIVHTFIFPESQVMRQERRTVLEIRRVIYPALFQRFSISQSRCIWQIDSPMPADGRCKWGRISSSNQAEMRRLLRIPHLFYGRYGGRDDVIASAEFLFLYDRRIERCSWVVKAPFMEKRTEVGRMLRSLVDFRTLLSLSWQEYNSGIPRCRSRFFTPGKPKSLIPKTYIYSG